MNEEKSDPSVEMIIIDKPDRFAAANTNTDQSVNSPSLLLEPALVRKFTFPSSPTINIEVSMTAYPTYQPWQMEESLAMQGDGTQGTKAEGDASEKGQDSYVSTHNHLFNLFRRLLPLIPVVFGATNSINMVNAQKSILQTRFTDIKDFNNVCNDLKKQYGNKAIEFDTCCGEGITGITLSCSFVKEVNVVGFYVAWCLIWVFVLVALNWMPRRYGTDDLRYYIAVAKAKTTKFTKTAAVLVIAFTVFGFLYVLVEIEKRMEMTAEKDVRSYTSAEKNNAIVHAILALAINVSVVFPLLRTPYPALRGVSMRKAFPHAIPVTNIIKPKLSNLWGMIQQPEEVFRVLTQGMIADLITGNDEDLEEMGDPAQLKRAMLLISAPKPQVDAKVAETTMGKLGEAFKALAKKGTYFSPPPASVPASVPVALPRESKDSDAPPAAKTAAIRLDEALKAFMMKRTYFPPDYAPNVKKDIRKENIAPDHGGEIETTMDRLNDDVV